MNYTTITDYDLQKDYVDKLTESEKIDLFKSLSKEIKSIAFEEWDTGNNGYYTDEFMIHWITNSYSKKVDVPYWNHPMWEHVHEDDVVNPHYQDKFKDYQGYDDWHDVVFTISKDIDVSQVDDNDQDVIEFNKKDNTIKFELPAFWVDVPLEYVVQHILNNVQSFIGEDVIDVVIVDAYSQS